MRGRKPKPAAIRALHGSRTRPQHHEEPTIPGADSTAETVTIAAPVGLIKAELVYWDIFAPLLAGAKILTPADVETLADYCRACVAVDERGKKLRKAYRGPMMVDDQGKRRRGEMDQGLVRLLDASLRGWVERKTKLAGELGLTAISRTRVAWSGHKQIVDKKQKPASKLAQLQERAAELRRPVGVK